MFTVNEMLFDHIVTELWYVPSQGLQIKAANFVGQLFRNTLFKAGQVCVKGFGWVVAQHAGFSCTAQGQQKQGIGTDHLVSLHGGKCSRSFHLQRLLPGLFYLKKKKN